MINFRIETENGIDYLQATARIPKRESEICECLTEMYEQGLLCFSFEVTYRMSDTHLGENGAQIIDIGPHNALTGVAVVSRPAYAESVALDLVAELKDGGELTAERGETMPIEKMNAEQTEETEDSIPEKEIPDDEDEKKESVAEGEGDGGSGGDGGTQETGGAQEQGDGTGGTGTQTDGTGDTGSGSDSGSGNGAGSGSDSGSGSGSDSGSGSESGSGSGSNDSVVKLPDPESDEKRTEAEVLLHEVETEQTFRKGCPECHEPDTVCTTVRETIVETVDGADAPVATAEEDEKDRVIAELKNRIAELEIIEGKYNEILKAEAEKALAEKQKQAKAFAEKQGLNLESEDVANAIAGLDYGALVMMSMAEQEETVAEEQEEAKPEPEAPAWYQMASYVDMNIKDNGEYGDMLSPVSK